MGGGGGGCGVKINLTPEVFEPAQTHVARARHDFYKMKVGLIRTLVVFVRGDCPVRGCARPRREKQKQKQLPD